MKNSIILSLALLLGACPSESTDTGETSDNTSEGSDPANCSDEDYDDYVFCRASVDIMPTLQDVVDCQAECPSDDTCEGMACGMECLVGTPQAEGQTDCDGVYSECVYTRTSKELVDCISSCSDDVIECYESDTCTDISSCLCEQDECIRTCKGR